MATHSSILAWRIPMDRGAWWATVYGITNSRTRSTATMENSVEIPLKIANRTALRLSNPTSGHTHQGNQN